MRALVTFLNNKGVNYQLTPAHSHQRDIAEWAIRTLKKHCVATLCGCDSRFKMKLWDRFLPHAFITFNLLRSSRINNLLSTYAQVQGHFDYNQTSLVPPGIKVMTHIKPDVRGLCDAHALEAWYTGYEMHHYRCYRLWLWETRSERTTDTLAWFPSTLVIPIALSKDRAIAAA